MFTDGVIERIAKQIIKYNNEIDNISELRLFEKDLEQVIKQIDRCVQAICDGVPSDRVKDKMLELEARKKELEFSIDETKLDVSIPLVESEIVFWFEQFIKGDINDELFRERLIDTFINKVILFNDKIIITYNIKEQESEKLTVKEILAEYNKNPDSSEFKLFQYGAVGGT